MCKISTSQLMKLNHVIDLKNALNRINVSSFVYYRSYCSLFLCPSEMIALNKNYLFFIAFYPIFAIQRTP